MKDALEKQTIDIDSVVEKIQQFTVETPSSKRVAAERPATGSSSGYPGA